MAHSQVTIWRRYTAAEKKAYRARVRRRQQGSWSSRGELIRHLADILGMSPEHLVAQDSVQPRRHHFADNLGSRVPTLRVYHDSPVGDRHDGYRVECDAAECGD